MMQVFFSSLNVLIIFLKRASGAHLDRIGSNWRLRAPDTLGEFQKIPKNREHLELIWIESDPIGGCELQVLSYNFKHFKKTESIWSSSGALLDRIGSDRIQLEAASSRYSRKISKNFKKPRASGAHLELIR